MVLCLETKNSSRGKCPGNESRLREVPPSRPVPIPETGTLSGTRQSRDELAGVERNRHPQIKPERGCRRYSLWPGRDIWRGKALNRRDSSRFSVSGGRSR